MGTAEFEGLAEVWLPESPQHHVTASVSFDPGHGVTLRLLGGPAAPQAEPPDAHRAVEAASRIISGLDALTDSYLAGQPRKIPELFGVLGDVPFVVLDATLRLVSGFAQQLPLVEIIADAVLLEFSGNAASASFDRMVVTTTWLTELASASGLRPQWLRPEGTTGGVRFSVSTEPVHGVLGTIEHRDGRVDVTLRLHHTQAVTRRSISIEEHADLELKFAAPVPLARLRELWIPAIEDLVTVASARRDAAEEVWLTSGGSGDIRAAGRAGARLLARYRHHPAPPDASYLPGVDGRFRIGDTELGTLFTNWMNLVERDGSAIQLILAASDRDASPVNLRAHVMGLNVAADWWHRHRFERHHTNPAEYETRVARVLEGARASEQVLPDDIQWLERKLENSNNKSHLDLLLDIASSVPDLVRDLVGDPDAFSDTGPGLAHDWARWVKNARNKGNAHPSNSTDFLGSYWAAESLRWVLIVAVLTDLGIPHAGSRIADDPAYQICRAHTIKAIAKARPKK